MHMQTRTPTTISFFLRNSILPGKMEPMETKRELWKINGVDIMIDTWPFLETFIEIEGENEENVRHVSEKLNFNWKDAIFAPVSELYKRKYKISEDRINNNTPKIVFDMKNPFIN